MIKNKITAEELRASVKGRYPFSPDIEKQTFEWRAADTIDACHHLLNHIHREVASLEDFDAQSLMTEIEQTLNGTKIYDDNKALQAKVAELERRIQTSHKHELRYQEQRDQARADLAKSNKLIRDIYEQTVEHLPFNCKARAEEIIDFTNLAAAKGDDQELKCVNGHDRCYLGPSDDCPYCERVEKPGTPDPRDARAYGSGGTSANPSTKDWRADQAPDTSGRATIPDFPENDVTDAAHPAWWRGCNYGTNSIIREVTKILDGLDGGQGVANDPWETVRRRLLALQATIAMQREALKPIKQLSEIFDDASWSDGDEIVCEPCSDGGAGNGIILSVLKVGELRNVTEALSTPPSDFIERIKLEERRKAFAECEQIAASAFGHDSGIVEDIRARSQEQG